MDKEPIMLLIGLIALIIFVCSFIGSIWMYVFILKAINAPVYIWTIYWLHLAGLWVSIGLFKLVESNGNN